MCLYLCVCVYMCGCEGTVLFASSHTLLFPPHLNRSTHACLLSRSPPPPIYLLLPMLPACLPVSIPAFLLACLSVCVGGCTIQAILNRTSLLPRALYLPVLAGRDLRGPRPAAQQGRQGQHLRAEQVCRAGSLDRRACEHLNSEPLYQMYQSTRVLIPVNQERRTTSESM
ncbi:hypothetical protein B484DRAFT_209387 [Ochromonadaceae sp. CCMP2298]|nr:hypothetical protein B484DRAFT_209387 [Ochromonadaceae sp. CCMP2298]